MVNEVADDGPEAASNSYTPTSRTRPARKRDRVRYERELIHAILDATLVSHLGYLDDGHPVVLPMLHVRSSETIYLHGSTGSRSILLSRGKTLDVCLTATLIDGLVLARSAFHHSVNYRSVLVHGSARRVEDSDEKKRALEELVNHVVPGRAQDCRGPSASELAATAVLALDLNEVSAKLRHGDPVDDPADLPLPHWAGTVPLGVSVGSPVASRDLDPEVPVPEYVNQLRAPWNLAAGVSAFGQ